MSGAAPHPDNVPLPALIAAGAVIGISILVAAVGGHHGAPAPETSPPVASRLLGFADLPDGTVGITDMATGGSVAVLPRGQDNFIRAIVRQLVLARRDAAPEPQIPFRLTAWRDGRLTLVDEKTGHSVDLEAFGATNEGDFARLLSAEESQK